MSAWHALTNFGDPFLTLPLASAILAWLMSTHRKQMAISWLVFFCLAAMLVGVTKFAYAGWGVRVSELEFTVISGHTMLSSAVYPLAFSLCLQSASWRYTTWGAISGFLFSALIGLSRVATGAHSPSEVIAGWILGSAVSSMMLAQLWQTGHQTRSSAVFNTGVITIIWLCYGHLAPIQGWIEELAPRLAKLAAST